MHDPEHYQECGTTLNNKCTKYQSFVFLKSLGVKSNRTTILCLCERARVGIRTLMHEPSWEGTLAMVTIQLMLGREIGLRGKSMR